jgi:hypothetical protein
MLPKITHKLLYKFTIPLFLWISLAALPVTVSALTAPSPAVISGMAATTLSEPVGKYACGGGAQAVKTTINIGCKGVGNPIVDSLFAIIRFLSIGVGLAIVAGLIIAGIQLTASKGDPQLRAKAISRIYNVVIALFVYIFAYAILNYVIPAGFFN